MKDIERAEIFFKNLEGLGYVKIKTGRWIEEVIDDGQGFPKMEYTCPICGKKSDHKANYCEECGARLNDE